MKIPEAYLNSAVQTASPARLVLALYDGVLTATGRARESLTHRGPGSIEAAHRELLRAQSILMELKCSLDHERGGAIASSLEALYGYWHACLVEANTRKSAAPLDVVEDGLRPLRESWAEACCGAVPA